MIGHSPVFQILLRVEVRMSIMTSRPSAWTNSAGTLSTPADFPIFGALIVVSTSSRRIWRPTLRLQLVSVGSQILLGPHPIIVRFEQDSVHLLRISSPLWDTSPTCLVCFSVIRSLASWCMYAFLLLFFLEHVSTSCCWPSIQDSFTIFMPPSSKKLRGVGSVLNALLTVKSG